MDFSYPLASLDICWLLQITVPGVHPGTSYFKPLTILLMAKSEIQWRRITLREEI